MLQILVSKYSKTPVVFKIIRNRHQMKDRQSKKNRSLALFLIKCIDSCVGCYNYSLSAILHEALLLLVYFYCPRFPLEPYAAFADNGTYFSRHRKAPPRPGLEPAVLSEYGVKQPCYSSSQLHYFSKPINHALNLIIPKTSL